MLLAREASVVAQSRVQVPAGCGSEEEFDSEIERLTGAPAAGAGPASVVIEPLAGDGGYELRLDVDGERRVLRDPECRVLWRSALVIVAASARIRAPAEAPPAAPPAVEAPPAAAPATVQVAPPATVQPPPSPAPASSPAPVRTAPPAPARPAATPPQPSAASVRRRPAGARAARRSRPVPERPAPATSERDSARAAVSDPPSAAGVVRYGLSLGGGLSSGVVPGASGTIELGGQLEVLPWAVQLSGRYWPESSESRSGRRVDVSGVGGRVAVLLRVTPAASLLAGVEVARLAGTGTRGDSTGNAAAAWQLAPTLGINMIPWDIGYLRIEFGLAGRASLLRPQFVVNGFGELYRAPPLGADAIIRGVWLFP